MKKLYCILLDYVLPIIGGFIFGVFWATTAICTASIIYIIQTGNTDKVLRLLGRI